MAKALDLIFLLFDVASDQEMPFGIPQYDNAFCMVLPMSFVDSEKCWYGAELVVACDSLNSSCCVTGWRKLASKHDGWQ